MFVDQSRPTRVATADRSRLLDVSATLERAMSVFEKEETSGKSLQAAIFAWNILCDWWSATSGRS